MPHRHHYESEEPGLAALERRTALPMLVLSAALVPVLLVPMLMPLDPPTMAWINHVDAAIWVVFAAEYAARFAVARERRRFVLHNWIDLATVLLPLVPHLQIAGSARTLRLLSVGRLVSVGLRSTEQCERIVNHRSVLIIGTALVTMVVGCAAIVYDVEHVAPGGNIRSVGDAFWWAIVTMTSVGYGDRYPVTTEGRLVASGLMILGICTSGLIAAVFTSKIVGERTEEEFDPQLDALRHRLDRIDRILELLESHAAFAEAHTRAEETAAARAGPARLGEGA